MFIFVVYEKNRSDKYIKKINNYVTFVSMAENSLICGVPTKAI